MTHDLKILPKYFEKVLSGEKTFEIRLDDRKFSVGDEVFLKEYDAGKYTGRSQMVRITYIVSSQDFSEGLKDGYVIFSTIKA